MAQENSATLAFNRGLLSMLGLARVDLTRYRMAAATMVNWIARVLGSMMLRPGRAYIGTTAGNAQAKTLPFVFAASDTARIEITQNNIQVWVDDALVTRVAVTAAVTNGNFAGSLAGWTNSSESGASVTWIANGVVSFAGTGNNNGILDQQVTVNQVGARHALRIIVTSGPFTFRCGVAKGDDTYINETTLNTGTHSLAFTPTGGSVWIRFENSNVAQSTLASCNIEAAGIMSLPAPWQTVDQPNLRWAQSADVVYIGCNGYPQMQIERRATDSWSIVTYLSNAGPFRPINITNVTLTASAISGNITLTANKPVFNAGHVGALFRLLSVGQLVTASLAAADTYTNPILVTGIGAQRSFTVNVSGSYVGTLTVQYSVGTPGTWINTTNTYSTPQTGTITDGLDNQTIYYRIGFTPGSYTSGSAVASLAIQTGQITGIVRVTGFTSNLLVNAAVLQPLGGTAATTEWYEGAWSTYRGFPATVQLWGGRLWWFGSSIYGSVSDDYTNFDDTTLGDSAPIIGQLDSGPVENIYWAIGLQQLVLGTATGETSCRSDYLGEAVTPTNFNVLTGSTQGSANVIGLQIDTTGVFVQVTTQRVFSLELDVYTYSYKSAELTLLVPDINSAGILQIAIQNKPDRRLHCRRGDGTVAIMVYDPAENVNCWLEVEAAGGGFIEDISILPGAGIPEDQVYYTVRYTINGEIVRYHEKSAMETECTGLPVAKHMDAHIVYQGAATTTIGGLSHLIGQTVCVWGWNTVTPYIDGNGNQPGLDLGTYVVNSSGQITNVSLGDNLYPVTNAVVGLGYTAQWESMKQAFAASLGTPLNQPKRIPRLGLVLQNTHAQGIRIGNDFEHLDDLPQSDLPMLTGAFTADSTLYTADSTAITVDQTGSLQEYADVNAILTEYDQQMSAFNDIWSTDSRVCLQAASPRPASCLAFTVGMTTNG